MSKHSYTVQIWNNEQWYNCPSGWSLGFCDGFLSAKEDSAPRLAHRILRSDGKVIRMLEAREDVFIGQIAGYPTALQYELAAERALAKAKAIREREEASRLRREGL